MIHWKGFILGLRAFARVEDQSSEFWFVGDGACHSELEEFVKINGLQNRVAFFGSLPREEVMQKIAEADVLVHPSFHDSAGLVCLEAMALGRPVVCLNTGGPAELVDENSGYRVAVDSEEITINGLHEVLETLASCPELRSSMGAAARKRVEEHFLWSKKADFFSEVYQQLIAR
jgi:glycosyltransferase involved in cell wall biosynthesis